MNSTRCNSVDCEVYLPRCNSGCHIKLDGSCKSVTSFMSMVFEHLRISVIQVKSVVSLSLFRYRYTRLDMKH